MSTAAELDRRSFIAFAHCYNSYSFAVFLAEQSHSTKFLCLRYRHFFHFYIESLKDILVYKSLNFQLFLSCHCIEM